MQIDPEQFNHLNESFNKAGATFSVVTGGSMLYSSKEMSGQIVLLTNGQARVIDEESTFGNQTICRADSPQIFGLNKILNQTFTETIRASTECSILI